MVDTTKELHVKSDASDFATGAVLSMKLKPEFFKVHMLRQGHLLIEGHEESILTKFKNPKTLMSQW